MESEIIQNTPEVAPPAPTESQGLAQAIHDKTYGISPQEPSTPAEPAAPVSPAAEVNDTPEPAQAAVTEPLPDNGSPAPSAAPAQDYSQWLQEQTGGKDLDAVKSILADPISVLPEHEQQLIRVARAGIEPMEYLQLQSTDFKSMEPMELERYAWQQENKTVPKEFQDLLFQDYLNTKYPNLGDEIVDETRAKIDQYNLGQNAQKIAAELEQKKEDLRLLAAPKLPSDGQPQQTEAEIEAQKAKELANAEAHLAAVNAALADDNLTFEVKAGDESRQVSFKISQKPEFKEAMTKPGEFVAQRWANPDGSIKYGQLKTDLAYLLDWKRVVQTAFEQGLSARESNVMNTLENPAPTATIAAPNTEPSFEGAAHAIASAQSRTGKLNY